MNFLVGLGWLNESVLRGIPLNQKPQDMDGGLPGDIPNSHVSRGSNSETSKNKGLSSMFCIAVLNKLFGRNNYHSLKNGGGQNLKTKSASSFGLVVPSHQHGNS